MTEKEIKEFIRQNKIQVPDDGKFMEELVSQMNLLPTPASLSAKDNGSSREVERLVCLVYERMKKHYRRQAIFTSVLCSAVCAVVFLICVLIPGSLPIPFSVRYLIAGGISLVILLLGIFRSGLLRI